MERLNNIDNKELRRFMVKEVSPSLAGQLGIVKGDYLMYLIEGNRLIMEKVQT